MSFLFDIREGIKAGEFVRASSMDVVHIQGDVFFG
jgi:hypothetical protein